MCRYCNCKLLVKNESGSVYYNDEENTIDILFGNMDLTLQLKSFFDFNNFIQSLDTEKIAHYINPLNGRIMIKPKALLTGYSFSKNEFSSLKKMFLDAIEMYRLELEIQHILSSTPQRNTFYN